MTVLHLIKTLTHVLLLVVIFLYILSGFGITNYHAVETITVGLLSKPLAFQLHSALTIPFLTLLALHGVFVAQKYIYHRRHHSDSVQP